MKMLQIPIEEKLMQQLKQIALDNNTTLRAIVPKMLEEVVERAEKR